MCRSPSIWIRSRVRFTINNPGNSTKYKATFAAKKIMFNTGDWAYTIDRVTGTTTANGSGGVAMNFPCHVGTAQF